MKFTLTNFKNITKNKDQDYVDLVDGILNKYDCELEEDGEASYLKVADFDEKIWVATSDNVIRAAQDPGETYNCPTDVLSEQLDIEYISNREKVRLKSKYYLGSTAVHVVFLSGPGSRWSATDKAAYLRDWIDEGHNVMNRTQRNDREAFPRHNFLVTSEESYYSQDPALVPVSGDYDAIAPNIKDFLKSKGVYNGNMSDDKWYANQPEVLQGFYDYINSLRDRYMTDWGYVVFAIQDPGSMGRAHAVARAGFYILFNRPSAWPWMTAHESFHMFGAADEYVDDETDTSKIDSCRSRIAGFYDIRNSNCVTTEGNKCVMSKNMWDKKWNERCCTVSANQLSLFKDDKGRYKPLSDYILHKYNMNDGHFRYEGGIYYTSDVIRENKSVWISATGKSKMHPWYNEHGPEGDTKTIVGNDHLLPNRPFSCVIGRWRSLDGRRVSNWFYIGKGGQWFKAPFTGYFVFNVNDKKGDFKDNSGSMTISLWTKLPDNYGALFVSKGRLESNQEDSCEVSESEIKSEADFQANLDTQKLTDGEEVRSV